MGTDRGTTYGPRPWPKAPGQTGASGRFCLRVTAIALSFAAFPAAAVSVGETYDQVVAEKGPPKSQITAGTLRILTYSDMVVRVSDGKVETVKVAALAVAAAPAKPASAADQRAQVLHDLQMAENRAIAIINQPVPSVPNTTDLKASYFPVLFHPGATRPDFATVDIRKTQETGNYKDLNYVTAMDHTDVAWPGSELEFNAMTKYFYMDRSVPKKKLTENEMLEVNRLYRTIAQCEIKLAVMGYDGVVP